MKPITLKRNWLDSVISYFHPTSGLQRDRARLAQQLVGQMSRKYDAGSSASRLGGWSTPSSGSANSEIGPALHRVRERSRDLVRNNPYAGRAVSTIESNVVGTGIIGQLKAPDGSMAQKFMKTMGAWKDWCESTDCDSDGLHNLYGLQALAIRTVVESGEALIIRKWRRKSDGYDIPVPFQIQVLEGDYIDTARNEPLRSGGYILQGIEFDQRGRRVAYWLWDVHPGEVLISMKAKLLSSRVSVDDVQHLYRVDRPGQVRGIPWGAPCVIRLKDFDDYEDAQLMRQKIAACFSAFVGDMEMPTDATAAAGKFAEELSPGTVEILPPGKTITFPNIPQVSDEGHASRVLRGIAMGYGVTYESISGDLSNVNFSSGRMGWIEMARNISKWQWLLFMPRFNTPVAKWFLQAANIQGYATEGVSFSWTPPKREMIDPTKEIPAKRDEIRSGLTSLSEAIRENGFIPEELFAEIKQDADTLDKLGLKLDCDPRNIAAGGTAQFQSSTTGGE
jgi:lambda family phage portal protein